MQDTLSSRSPLVNRLLIAGAVVLVLVVVGAVTILLLKNVVPKRETAIDTVTVKANEVVAIYAVPGMIKGLSDSLYDHQFSNDGATVPVVYKLDNQKYIANTPTVANVLFYSKTASPQGDTKAIQDQTTAFMQSKGFEKTANPMSVDSKSTTRITYKGGSVVCQLTSSGPSTPEGSPSSHQLACANTADIENEYAAVADLLKLYGKTPTFTEAYRQTETEDNKAYTILRLINSGKSPKLLFAAVDDKWSYLGDLNGTDGTANAKYVISPDIKNKISDSKYGSFLTKNLQGQSGS